MYQVLSRTKEVKRLISDPLPMTIDTTRSYLYIPFRERIQIDPTRRRDAHLPKSVPEPKLNLRKKVADSSQIKFTLSPEEARTVSSYLGMAGRVDSQGAEEQLSDEIKAAILLHRRGGGLR